MMLFICDDIHGVRSNKHIYCILFFILLSVSTVHLLAQTTWKKTTDGILLADYQIYLWMY